MDEKQMPAELGEEEIETEERAEEPVYVIPPHPEVTAPLNKEATASDEPIAAEGSLPDLIQQAMEELRGELMAELETQATRIQADLQDELQSELQKELKVGLELNAKN